jgi:predicted dehydrogenase
MIVVWGYGSIGSRHLDNLLSLKRDNLALITQNPGKIKKTLSKLVHVVDDPNCLDWTNVNGLIIATPTAFHSENIIFALTNRVKKIYLEKPVSDTYADIDKITALINAVGATVYVGYDLRYDPGINKARDIIRKDEIGNVCSFHAHVGQYLPDWRRSQDYRKSMSAFHSLGGGVMLDLSHELDYLYYLFGEVAYIANSNGKRGDLDIETEDTSDSLIFFKEEISGTIHLDYLQKPPVRFLHIIASRGTLHLDLLERLLTWNTNDSDNKNTMEYTSYNRNDRFVEIIGDFVSSKPSDKLCTWTEGVKSLKVIVESKTSNRNREIRSIR